MAAKRTKSRSRRQRKKLRLGEFQTRAFPIDTAIATRALLVLATQAIASHIDGRFASHYSGKLRPTLGLTKTYGQSNA